VVGADRGPGAVVAGVGGARARLGDPRRRPARPARGGQRRGHPRPRPVHLRRRPGHPSPGGHPPRAVLHHPGRPASRSGDEPRRAHLGEQRGGVDLHADRHLRAGQRDRPAAAVGPAPARGHAGRRVGLAAPVDARPGDHQGRAGAGGGPRPAARPAARRGAARVAVPSSGGGARLVPGPGRPGGRPGPAGAAEQPGATVDRREPGPRDRRVAGYPRPPVRRAGRRTADGLPHHLAAGAGGRPAARARRHDRRGGPASRLRQPVRAQRRLQAGPGSEPEGAPRCCHERNGRRRGGVRQPAVLRRRPWPPGCRGPRRSAGRQGRDGVRSRPAWR